MTCRWCAEYHGKREMWENDKCADKWLGFRAGAEAALAAVRTEVRGEACSGRWSEDEADNIVIDAEVATDAAREKLGLGK